MNVKNERERSMLDYDEDLIVFDDTCENDAYINEHFDSDVDDEIPFLTSYEQMFLTE